MRRELARETAGTRIILDSRRSCHAATAASAPASPGVGAVLLFTPGPNHLSHKDRAPFAALPRPRTAYVGLVRPPLTLSPCRWEREHVSVVSRIHSTVIRRFL